MQPAQSQPSELASRVAGWELLERVGAGATSEVWRATRGDGALAAIKIVRDGSIARTEMEIVARLGRVWGPRWLDGGALASTRAPSLLPEDGGGWFLATTWVPGAPLDPAHVGTLPPEERTLFVTRVGPSLARAQSLSLLLLCQEFGKRHGSSTSRV